MSKSFRSKICQIVLGCAALTSPLFAAGQETPAETAEPDAPAQESGLPPAVGDIEAIVLDDQGWAWLARIDTASDGDDVSAPHSSQSAETASTKSMSSEARSAAATSSDWR